METNEPEVTEEEEIEEDESPSVDLEARIKRLEEKAIQQRERTRILRQENEKLKKASTQVSTKSNELSDGQKALLVAYGFTESDEHAIFQDYMQRTGETVEQARTSDIIMGKINNLRDEKMVKAAVPEGTKRSQSFSSRETVDYWVAKGEMPPADKQQLRRDVVNARMKSESQGSKFSDNPLIR